MGDKMSSVDSTIDDARRMADFILHRKFRGPGDTIERAAFEAEQTWGVPASILMRLRHRRAEMKDMLLSNWLAVSQAYQAACSQVERAGDHQKQLAENSNAAATRLYQMAALLDRQEEEHSR